MGSLTILFVSKLNEQLKMLTNKVNTVTLNPIKKKHLSNYFTAIKSSTIIN